MTEALDTILQFGFQKMSLRFVVAQVMLDMMEKIYRVATVAGVEILRQRQLKDSVPDLRWVSAETFYLIVERSRNTAFCLFVECSRNIFVKIHLISPSQYKWQNVGIKIKTIIGKYHPIYRFFR